ncbi:MAG: DUF1840 domain-containing protein [Oxalobacteraceae bacterium]|jgi:hypothetical protein|nr:DUF1840 domain-containing protein [Oxalobacteraceae bacterium]
MLVTFKSKAAAEILMYEAHAKPILDLLGKDIERGVITADETGQAIERIESEIAARKVSAAAPTDDEDSDGGAKKGLDEVVSFGARAYPLLEMLRAAHREHAFVMWGV